MKKVNINKTSLKQPIQGDPGSVERLNALLSLTNPFLDAPGTLPVSPLRKAQINAYIDSGEHEPGLYIEEYA